MGSWRIGLSRARIARLAHVLMLSTLVVGAAVSGDAPQPAHARQEAGGRVRVVHGLRGLVADIYVDGQLVLPSFHPRRSTDPIAIPSGDHRVEIRTAGAAMSRQPLLSRNVSVPSGFLGSLVAHLDGSGEPTLTAFRDDVGTVPAGQSRVVVRHAADAERVHVRLDDRLALAGVAPSNGAATLVSAGEYRLSVTPTKGGMPLASPQAVDYAEGTANFMYLIGSQEKDTLGWAVVRIDDLQTAPKRIQTGDGSSGSNPSGRAAVAMWTIAGLLALGGAASLRARRWPY